jgi:hypothetical protein
MLSFSNLFNLVVYTQPFLWLWLLQSSWRLNIKWFYGSGAAVIAWLLYSGFSLNYYTTDLLVMYVLMVFYAVYVNSRARPLHAVSIGFILVFVNSYFWEFPIHAASFVENPVVGNQLVQALHAVPLFLLVYLYHSRLTISPLVKCVESALLVWMLVSGVTYLRMTVFPSGVLGLLLNHVLRWIALFTLTGLIRLKLETARQ